jgi:L-fuconolactonase
LNVVTEAFGVDRLMFGSDWPVNLLAASYHQSFDIASDFFSKFSEEEQDKILGKNAVSFYNL